MPTHPFLETGNLSALSAENVKMPNKKKAGRNLRDSRTKYWRLHEQPLNKMAKKPGFQRRLRASDFSLAQTIAELGSTSDVAVAKLKTEELTRNRAFAEHQQKLRGAIERLRRIGTIPFIPHRVELLRLKAAFQVTEDAKRGR